MDKIHIAVLVGLNNFGRQKTFIEILEETGIQAEDVESLDVANALEGLGLIQNVTYQLPVSIRADISFAGKEYLTKLQNDSIKT